MFYFSNTLIDQLLLDDISGGDATTRALALEGKQGVMTLTCREQCRVSGVQAGLRMLKQLDLHAEACMADGSDTTPGTVLLEAHGPVPALQQGWKAVQNVLEWCGGVATYMASMIQRAHALNPALHIACTRKCIPGTKALATAAVVHGGGIVHRGGTAESILLFANHRCFLENPEDWNTTVAQLRQAAPEKKIIVEADTMQEATAALATGPDILQLDKFSPDDVRRVMTLAAGHCLIAAAGGINMNTVEAYAATGVPLLVTSAPYYAKPVDIQVRLTPA